MAARKKKTTSKKKATTAKQRLANRDKELEKNIENTILDWINLRPRGFAFKVNTVGIYDASIGGYRKTGKYTLKGTSDILGLWHDKFLAIEVKTARGRVSAEQKAFIDKVKSQGGIAFVARSLDEAIKHLEYFARHGSMIVS
jgi:penicillin-binding protein-related factor A (putative recombinase)